jgi:hypothetical protein
MNMVGVTILSFPPKENPFFFREVAPWGREHGWSYHFVPFSPKEVALGKYGQGYHFVLLSLWKKSFCSLGRLV